MVVWDDAAMVASRGGVVAGCAIGAEGDSGSSLVHRRP